jgi:hypothetical protein
MRYSHRARNDDFRIGERDRRGSARCGLVHRTKLRAIESVAALRTYNIV